MKKIILFCLTVVILPLAAASAPAPDVLIVNNQEKKCAHFWAGDECYQCSVPSGWEKLGSDSTECPSGYTDSILSLPCSPRKTRFCCTENHSGTDANCEDMIINNKANQCAFVMPGISECGVPASWTYRTQDIVPWQWLCPFGYEWIEDFSCGLEPIEITNAKLYDKLRGKIILRVEDNGEAYYIHPKEMKMYYLGRPRDAFNIMRELGAGITNDNLDRIQIAQRNYSGSDTDGDGLPDALEDSIGTNKNASDTDGDNFSDKDEVFSGFNPKVKDEKMKSLDDSFAKGQVGRIFLQVEKNGEAWYVSPADSERHFLGRPADAFSVMRELGLGVSNSDFMSLLKNK